MSSIDYDLKKIRAIVMDVDGVLSPQTVPIDADGEPLRMSNVRDGYAIKHAVKSGLKLAIISGARSERVRLRFNKLGINDIWLDISDKLPVLKQWIEANGLRPEEVAYFGDDNPDKPCMQYVGLSCCPADAAMDIQPIARWISRFPGGGGCVRQLIEETMKAQGTW